MRVLDKLRDARAELAESGVENAGREAELIIAHGLGTDRVGLYKDNPEVPAAVLARIDEFLRRRAGREPLQYILGFTEFCGLRMRVGPGVLIPRPETELMAEEAARILAQYAAPGKSLRVLDLCTGSGCVAIALARQFPEAAIYGTDTSGAAIGYATDNAARNRIPNVTFLQGSLFEPFRSGAENLPVSFDLIVANPPYIRREDLKLLQPEIREWEPASALDGGESGLDFYRIMIPEAGPFLRENGSLIVEMGAGQAKDIGEMARSGGFPRVSVVKDYAGIERILIAVKE